MTKLTIFFDSNCNFCMNTKRVIESLDKNNEIKFIPLQEDEFELRAETSDGTILINEEVLPELIQILPGIRRFSWMFKGKMGEKTNKLFYEGLERIKNVHNRLYKGCCK